MAAANYPPHGTHAVNATGRKPEAHSVQLACAIQSRRSALVHRPHSSAYRVAPSGAAPRRARLAQDMHTRVTRSHADITQAWQRSGRDLCNAGLPPASRGMHIGPRCARWAEDEGATRGGTAAEGAPERRTTTDTARKAMGGRRGQGGKTKQSKRGGDNRKDKDTTTAQEVWAQGFKEDRADMLRAAAALWSAGTACGQLGASSGVLSWSLFGGSSIASNCVKVRRPGDRLSNSYCRSRVDLV